MREQGRILDMDVPNREGQGVTNPGSLALNNEKVELLPGYHINIFSRLVIEPLKEDCSAIELCQTL